MLERKYRILMQTPIGDRAGTLEVQIEQNKIHGYLDMLNHSEPFVGSIDEEGCNDRLLLGTFCRRIQETLQRYVKGVLIKTRLFTIDKNLGE